MEIDEYSPIDNLCPGQVRAGKIIKNGERSRMSQESHEEEGYQSINAVCFRSEALLIARMTHCGHADSGIFHSICLGGTVPMPAGAYRDELRFGRDCYCPSLVGAAFQFFLGACPADTCVTRPPVSSLSRILRS